MNTPPAPRPTFLGIGAGKAGTSWVWDMLRRHPEVFLPARKELHWFDEQSFEGEDVPNRRAQLPVEWYLDWFRDASPGQVCGEITPSYIWNPTAAARIHAFDPAMKLFATLRDPVERLFSAFLFGMQVGEIPADRTFEQTLEERPYLIERSMYGACLTRYLDLFPAEQLHVMFLHDIRERPDDVLKDLERFIGVDQFVPEVAREATNVTGQPVNPRATRRLKQLRVFSKRHGLERFLPVAERLGLRRVYRYLRRSKPFDERPRMAAETEARLRDVFASDIGRLETMLGVNLASWKPSTSSSAPNLRPMPNSR